MEESVISDSLGWLVCFRFRRLYGCAQVLHLVVVLLLSGAILAACESQVEHTGCKSFADNINPDIQDVISGEDLGFESGNLDHRGRGSRYLDNVCHDSNLFCFRSTLPGLLSQDHDAEPKSAEVSGAGSVATSHARSTHMRANISWSSDCDIFKFTSGRTISCSLNSQKGCGLEGHDASCREPFLGRKTQYVESNKGLVTEKSGISYDFSPNVEVSPAHLDWGQKYLFFPSVAFVEVTNTHRDDLLTIYEPYSTNAQFYPCNSSEILLEPGESVSMCFVFLPTWLGLASARFVLQTSSGGFLIQATGFAIESPYKIQSLVGLDVSSSGKWRKNLSLFNPFDEALYVEEVVAWISVSAGNTSYSTRTVCGMNSIEDQHESLLTVKEWIDVKSSEVGLPLVSMRPHRSWEVGPLKTETIMELDVSFPGKGNIFGAFCMQLQRSSTLETETVLVPLEAEHRENTVNIEHASPVSLSLEILVPYGSTGNVVINLSMKNDAPYVVKVVKISEVGDSTNLFHIKYVEGIVLFPNTVTQIASISLRMLDTLSELSGSNMNCELLVLTNDSRNDRIKVSCRDLVHICSRHIIDSSVGSVQWSESVGSGKIQTQPSNSAKKRLLLNEVMNSPAVDELVLKNWKSHATVSGTSVLDDNEVLFPVVEVGNHSSAFVNVRNPSDQPVVMQLILHSGEIIDECKGVDGPLQPSASSSLSSTGEASPARYGFSTAEGALTEALVHPFGRASLGPLLFQPSDRCGWRSSVLVRNNLSGVEWLSLRGIGGSFSMVLFEESRPVQSLDFKLSFPTLHVSSSRDMQNVEETIHVCSQPIVKELYARNIGELPLEIRSIKVSGTKCGLDGFAVQTCKGFRLEPGNAMKLIITYQSDFSVATIHRDLELVLGTGTVVIPMKATLPLYMLSFCKKTIFWMRVKKFAVAVLVTASVCFLLLGCFLPCMASFSQGYFFKTAKRSISATKVEKSSYADQSQKRYGKLTLSARMNGLLRSIGEEQSHLLEPSSRFNDGRGVTKQQISTAKAAKSAVVLEKSSSFKDKEKVLTPLVPAIMNSVAVDSSDSREMSQTGNLKVKTGKDKGRRQKKKKNSGNGIAGLFEVSSSQSGNSTPSSPLSPASSLTPKTSRPVSPEVNYTTHARDRFAVPVQRCESRSSSQPRSKGNVLPSDSVKPYGKKNHPWGVSTQEKLDVLPRMPGKPVLLPSATFPSAGRPNSLWSSRPTSLASTSTIAPHARAPGSKLQEQKAVKTETRTEFEDQFRYDIWGEHIFGVPYMDRSKDTSGLKPHTTENTSCSFFVTGPQTLKSIAQPDTKNCYNEVG
ncbi:OLC1v1010122C2 [Oldenlandia corymbosa var. corymbosa]|uniref:OLC1v1010122C2 n=1 Tax=Oldenlandia corymbosa var. corymbosa TaxID=529605 RepID=A0AAV1DT03_OLDCO|nr:OLC1v1010122C2 [Oldenlandia corymbosa var. corymbosa]